ncbi:hypothetical protein [Liquorilactobacillus mali]|uniref:Bacterial Pleckstrin homology domain-containing protein n=1 Tax=Liquorilactobacillus mali KCTC 3596 = DSM 20444 TaxID=1046596 RepID=J1F2P8_9LACO|nr:hypothetical protein [Liquorilactobacillus mali]EJE99341.1 hypothetical protein LMA_05831 [Liquorilactobacillus mali KCTC 3596 = DSM 20444]KRN05007.1 hypothetical protein FD00_GL000314 [Liquorilactobacillus mali KCTC 3596 = DSM 20444]QFQ75750.1 hypothetical protein LM596_11985 [Liquorilactobacillus mali]
MQNKVEIKNNKLLVIPQGINKLASLKERIEVSLQNVVGASIDTGILNESKGIKFPGTTLPGYWSGSFKKIGKESFFNIKRGNKPVVIQLKNEKYTRLILGVDNPENVVDLINNSIN